MFYNSSYYTKNIKPTLMIIYNDNRLNKKELTWKVETLEIVHSKIIS